MMKHLSFLLLFALSFLSAAPASLFAMPIQQKEAEDTGPVMIREKEAKRPEIAAPRYDIKAVTPGSVSGGLYTQDDLKISFKIPAGWTITERPRQTHRPAERSTWGLYVQSPQGELVGMTVFWDSNRLEDFVARHHHQAMEQGQLDFKSAEGLLSGKRAVIWESNDDSGQNDDGFVILSRLGKDKIFQVGIGNRLADPAILDNLIRSITLGSGGDTILPVQIEGRAAAPTEVASCANCPGETDATSNVYPCCTTFGNCTWKAEQLRAGANNFSFGGVSYKDAYKWMSLADTHTTLGQGGTIPQIGAVMVYRNSWYTYGHVATVTAIGTDGTLTVNEQACDLACGRTRTYAPASLVQYLAGYLYTSTGTPTPSAKTVTSIGSSIIEDYNNSNVYHFVSVGPGSVFSGVNNGYRTWGTNSGGSGSFFHYILSKTGTSENYGQWRGSFQAAGNYQLDVWIPNNALVTATAVQYEVGGLTSNRINQSATKGTWVKVVNPGRADGYWVAANAGLYSVTLRDTGNTTAGQTIAFDAVRWTKK